MCGFVGFTSRINDDTALGIPAEKLSVIIQTEQPVDRSV